MNPQPLKQVAFCVLGALLTVPLALVVTFILSPFWNWLETATGIESFGHSGPSDWCYLATYLTLLTVFAITYWLRKKRV